MTDRAVLTVVEHDVTAFCERDPDGNERVASNDATLLDVADARLASAIEALTGQRISAVLSGSHPGSSSSFELFLLEG